VAMVDVNDPSVHFLMLDIGCTAVQMMKRTVNGEDGNSQS
jgi:hypothetical protein